MAKASTVKQGKQEVKIIKIEPIHYEYVMIHLVGETPLLQNRFSEEAKEGITKMYTKEGELKGRKALDTDAKFRQSMHPIIDNHYTHPAIAFKEAAIAEIRQIDKKSALSMVAGTGAFHVYGEDYLRNPGYVFIKGCVVECQYDMGSPNGTPIPIFRPRYWPWWTTLVIRCRTDGLLSTGDVTNLLNRAGDSIGVGSYRVTGKKASGSCGMNGMFHVAPTAEVREKFPDEMVLDNATWH